MRLVHMTDVHFYRAPELLGVVSKRALGLANLHIGRRIEHFDADGVVPSAVADALTWEPDAFVMTGDLSALASEAEFAAAREAFAPILESVPSAIVPGNHDRYTRGALRDQRLERWFGDFIAGGAWDEATRRWLPDGDPAGPMIWPVRFRIGTTDIIGTDPTRPTLRSTGRFLPGAIDRAADLIDQARTDGQQVVYLVHYPPLDDQGSPYDHPSHGLVDVRQLLAGLRRSPPDLILHGHAHRCWKTALGLEDGRSVPVLNCGSSSARSSLPDRTAGYFVIELVDGRISSLRRRILPAGAEAWEDGPIPGA
jgi:3',5'-cyclic AMP phosphodiesterase CpdA